jgi:hypothetical protein
MDNKKYAEQINTLKDKFFIDDIALDRECDLDTLHYYDLVVFLLNPMNIGNKFFISGINTILEKRKSSKTILFMVNDVHILSTQDIVNVRNELMKSLNGVIENPDIHFCSTFYGGLYISYIKGKKTIVDLQKESNLMIPMPDGAYLSGRDIEKEHIEEIQRISGIKKISETISTYLEGLSQENIDVTKRNLIVIGQKEVGKTTLVDVVSRLYGENISIGESNDFTNINEMLYEKIIVMIDLNLEKDLNFIEEICSQYINSDKIFIVNKIDNYMFYGKDKKETIAYISAQLKQFTQSPCSFISAYYMKQLLDLEAGIITIMDVALDNNIVFEDSLGFPLCKERNKKNIIKLLKEASGQDELLKYLEV